MAPSNKELEQQLAQLQEDNEQLRGMLAAAGARPASVVPAPPPLNEANRQELEGQGFTSIGGVLYTSDEAKAYAKAIGQDVEWNEPAQSVKDAASRTVGALRIDPDTGQRGIRGVTHVWPSVEPGGIDPAVAGTPGISGPAAGSDQARLRQQTPAANVGTDDPTSTPSS